MTPSSKLSTLLAILLASSCDAPNLRAQEAAKPSEKAQEKTPEIPAQIELLETKVRFEVNGDSRKEVHARVHINNELGVRQFARLNFDYNRSFQQVEIPLVRITHTSGGTADILPSATSDQPNPAVINAPAYEDVRVKSVRILGLEPSDNLEYRVVTTMTHHPLAPDFWLDHTFDRTDVVKEEVFDLELPTTRQVQLQINPATPASPAEARDPETIVHHWRIKMGRQDTAPKESPESRPDIVLTSFGDWQGLAARLKELLKPTGEFSSELFAKVDEIAKVSASDSITLAEIRAEAIYTLVSQKIKTVDLPLGSTGFKTRNPADVLASGYGTPEDKYILFAALADNFFGPTRAGLVSIARVDAESPPSPDFFNHLLTMSGYPSINFWLDLNIEVAPYKVIPSEFRRRKALLVGPAVDRVWQDVDDVLPFRPVQIVKIDATLGSDGNLRAKAKYVMRGDNELLLRVAFHQSPKDKWKDVAQLLALSDGFRGKITNVTASDPYATKEPFTVEYEISQPKFVDWSKKPVRIPALLPLVGLPDPPAKTPAGTASSAIELGTPLDVRAEVTLHLPPGTIAHTPTGTSVERDYAKFASQYSANGSLVSASRHLNFLLREVPASRAADYSAFVRAVQNDEAQDLTLERPDASAQKPASSTSSAPTAGPKPLL